MKVTSQLFEQIKNSLEKLKQTKQWQDKNYIPHASTWLNQKRWKDEVEIISNNVDVF